MEFEKTFGETIRSLRKEKGMPLREVALALSIDISMLGKIEKNSRRPTRYLIEKMAQFFDVSDKDLMIAFLSDTIAYQVLCEGDFAGEVLKVAEKKIKYSKNKKNPKYETDHGSIG